MALSHIKSLTQADWTGTVTVFDYQGNSATVAGTDLIRPVDWNSGHNEFVTLSGNTTQGTTASGADIRYHASGGALVGGTSNSVIFSLPVLSAYQPHPLISGSAASSQAPASWWFNKVSLPAPVTISNVFLIDSVSGSGAVAARSMSYSRGITIFKRVGFDANSTQLTTVTTASMGMSWSMNPGGAASNFFTQQVVTNSTGGSSSQTYSVANSTNASSIFSGNKLFCVPLILSLSEGEYFFAHAHSSTTGGGAAIWSYSQVYISAQNITMGALGSAGSVASDHVWHDGEGVASAVTTNNTMAISVISQATRQWIYFHLANHATI